MASFKQVSNKKTIVTILQIAIVAIFCMSILSSCKSDEQRANDLYAKRDYVAAAELFHEIGDRNMYANCIYQIGQDLVERGELEQAATYFDELINLEWDSTRSNALASYLDVLDAIEQGNYELALELLEPLRKILFADSIDVANQIKSRQEQERLARGVNRNQNLIEYLESVGYDGDFLPDKDITVDANVVSLMADDLFKNDKVLTAELIGRNSCYEVILEALNDLRYTYTIMSRNMDLIQTNAEFVKYETLMDYGKNNSKIDMETLLWAIISLPDGLPQEYEHIPSAFNQTLEMYKTAYEISNNRIPMQEFERLLGFCTLVAQNHDKELLYGLYQNVFESNSPEFAIINSESAQKLFGDFEWDKEYLAFGPKRIFSPEDFTVLLGGQFIPNNPINGGYVRILDLSALPPDVEVLAMQMAMPDMYQLFYPSTIYAVTNPNNARFAVYESLDATYEGMYQSSGSDKQYAVYLPVWDVRIVDLVTGDTIMTDRQSVSAKQSYIGGSAGNVYVPFDELNWRVYADFMVSYRAN